LAVLAAGAISASATTLDTESFTVTVPTGAGQWGGQTFTGSFTWNPTEPGKILSFTSNIPIWTAGSALPQVVSLVNPPVPTYPYPGFGLYFDPPEDDQINAFALYGIGAGTGTFTYGIAGDESSFKAGVIKYDPPVSNETPEPGTFLLLATGLAGTLGAVRRKLGL
jgi:hypothetical protein